MVQESDWIFVKGLEKLRKKRADPWVHWAPFDVIYDITVRKQQFTGPEIECLALAVLCVSTLLRLGEAWSAYRVGLGKLVFTGEKNRPGVQV